MPTFMLNQVGCEELTNYTFILEAPWKACRLCGALCQSPDDRAAYKLHKYCGIDNGINHHLCELAETKGRQIREDWLRRHNLSAHTRNELEQFANSGLEVTAIAAAKLATYGIIHISGIGTLDPDEDQALLEAPRAPIVNADDW